MPFHVKVRVRRTGFARKRRLASSGGSPRTGAVESRRRVAPPADTISSFRRGGNGFRRGSGSLSDVAKASRAAANAWFAHGFACRAAQDARFSRGKACGAGWEGIVLTSDKLRNVRQAPSSSDKLSSSSDKLSSSSDKLPSSSDKLPAHPTSSPAHPISSPAHPTSSQSRAASPRCRDGSVTVHPSMRNLSS